jgi:hypothetical protein
LAPGTVLAALESNRIETSESVVESSVLGPVLPKLAKEGFRGTATELLDRLVSLAGYEAARSRWFPSTGQQAAGIVRRLAPALRTQGISVEFERVGHARQRIITVGKASDPDASDAEVLAFAKPVPSTDGFSSEVTSALRVCGVDASWPVSKAAALALQKAGSNAFAAAAALNELGIPAPDGGAWTAVAVRGVV